MRESGITLLEVVAAILIATLAFYSGMTLYSATASSQRRLTSLKAVDQIQAEAASTAMSAAFTYLLQKSTATAPSVPCVISSPADYFTFNPTLGSGLALQLLDSTTTPFTYTPASLNQPYSDSLNRCQTANTVYKTKSGTIQSPIGNAIYFCALLNNTGNSPESIAYMQPILMEFLFVPYDVNTQTQRSCSSLENQNVPLTTGGCATNLTLNYSWPGTVMGMLYYTIHWSTVGTGNTLIANHYHGYLASVCPAG